MSLKPETMTEAVSAFRLALAAAIAPGYLREVIDRVVRDEQAELKARCVIPPDEWWMVEAYLAVTVPDRGHALAMYYEHYARTGEHLWGQP